MQRETLILGIGNPILTDDAVGLYAVRELKKLCQQSQVVNQLLAGADLDEFTEGGIGFLDAISGYRRVIIIDAVQTEGGIPGEIAGFPLDELAMQATGDSHSINACAAIDLGKHCGYAMPEIIHVYSVEAADCTTFGMVLSPAVDAVFPRLVRKILSDFASGLGELEANRTASLCDNSMRS